MVAEVISVSGMLIKCLEKTVRPRASTRRLPGRIQKRCRLAANRRLSKIGSLKLFNNNPPSSRSTEMPRRIQCYGQRVNKLSHRSGARRSSSRSAAASFSRSRRSPRRTSCNVCGKIEEVEPLALPYRRLGRERFADTELIFTETATHGLEVRPSRGGSERLRILSAPSILGNGCGLGMDGDDRADNKKGRCLVELLLISCSYRLYSLLDCNPGMIKRLVARIGRVALGSTSEA
jgi:hypothetical protein